MTIHLLNAAVMPQSGSYELVEIDADSFARAVQDGQHHHELRHYIGYKTTITMIEELCDIRLGDINTDKTVLQSGDVLLIARLKYRIDKDTKGRDRVSSVRKLFPEDFEFYIGRYAEGKKTDQKEMKNSEQSQNPAPASDLMRTILDICHCTHTDLSDVSINLENQRVYVDGKEGRYKRVQRSIYRARFDGNRLIGNINKRDGSETFPLYVYNVKNRGWYPDQHKSDA